MKAKNDVLLHFLFSSIFLIGILIPYNIQWYGRFLFEHASILDYLCIFIGLIVSFILIFIPKLKSSKIIIICWSIQIIFNIVLGNILSISSTDINSGPKISVRIFDNTYSMLLMTIPLVFLLFAGITGFSFGMKLFSHSTFYNNLSEIEKYEFIGKSLTLSFILFVIIRSITENLSSNLFLITPIGGLIGLFSIINLKSELFVKTNTQNSKLIKNKNYGFIYLKFFAFLFLILSNLIFIIISSLALFPQLKHYNLQTSMLLIQFISSIILMSISILFTLLRKFNPPKSDKIYRNLIFGIVLDAIFVLISFINSFNPNEPFNYWLQIILHSFGLSIIYIISLKLILDESNFPLIFSYFFSLLIINSSYLSRIPLKIGEIWNQNNIYIPILIVNIVISILIPFFLKKLSSKSANNFKIEEGKNKNE